MKLLSKLFASIALMSVMASVQAFDKEPFTQERFDELQAAGEVVLVDVFATWCPTCKKQQEAMSAYFEANPDQKIHVLVVDFDDNKDLVSKFRAPRQSTLILYKNNEQIWFSVAESRADVIAAEFDKALTPGS